MHTVSGHVWTETDRGWLLRSATQGDDDRRALHWAWQHSLLISDGATHEMRPMRYADVLRGVREQQIHQFECAPENLGAK